MADQVKGIQSVEIAAGLLDVVIESPQPLRLKELAAGAGMSASKARMYAVSLVRSGLIDQDPVDGRYIPGRKALRIGMLALAQDRLLTSARRAMSNVGERTGDPVLLSVWDRDGSMIVASHESTGPLPMTFRVGSMTPLDTATGLVFLAHLPLAVAERAIAAHIGHDHAATLVAALPDVLARGFATATTVRLNAGAAISGYGAIAVPVFGRDHRIELVITALHPSSLDEAGKRQETRLLLAAAAEVSAQAGF